MCKANQLTGFAMMATLAFNRLKIGSKFLIASSNQVEDFVRLLFCFRIVFRVLVAGMMKR